MKCLNSLPQLLTTPFPSDMVRLLVLYLRSVWRWQWWGQSRSFRKRLLWQHSLVGLGFGHYRCPVVDHLPLPRPPSRCLAHGISDTKELLLVGVLIRFGHWHWCRKVGLQNVLLAKENLSLLDPPCVQALRLPAMTTSDTERCHAVVSCKGHHVYLKHIFILTVIVYNGYKWWLEL